MPDNYVLYGPGGASPINVGTWLNTGEGQPDFDLGNVFRTRYVENAGVDDAFAAYTTSGKRTFRFPLLLSGAAPSLIDQTSAQIRRHLVGGGYIDMQPQGVPSAAAVRFDVLGGQLVDQYNTFLQGANRRRSQLDLAVRPFGYWPTEILLASIAAGTWGPQRMTWNPGSVIGDGPGLGRLNIIPTIIPSPIASAAGLHGHEMDGFAWSIGRASGATLTITPSAFNVPTGYLSINAASTPIWAATRISEASTTPFGSFWRVTISPTANRWVQVANFAMPPEWTPQYEGRFRIWAYARTTPSWNATGAYNVTADVGPGASGIGAFHAEAQFLASAAPVAKVLPMANASFSDVTGVLASGAWQLFDLGEHQIPYGPSGVPGRSAALRFWCNPNASLTTGGGNFPNIDFGGFWLQPLSGPNGVLARGMLWPTAGYAVASTAVSQTFVLSLGHKVQLDRIRGRAFLSYRGDDTDPAVASDTAVLAVLDGHHRGALPLVPASAGSLDLLPIGRKSSVAGATNGIFQTANGIRMSLYYRPQFAFMPGGVL